MLILIAPLALAAPLDPAAFDALAPTLTTAEPIQIHTGDLTLTIGTAPTHTGVLHDGIAVFTFGEVDLQGFVSVVGDAPVAILAHGDLTVDGTLEASAIEFVPGPGGYAGATEDGDPGAGPGGGPGDQGAGGGAFGGVGGEAGNGDGGGLPYNDDLVEGLEGGSGGGRSSDDQFILLFWNNGDGGGGGGAVELGASGRLDIGPSAEIRVDGAPGQDDDEHGGGGGSGGGILLHGQGGTCAGLLSARGGAGGSPGFLFLTGGGGSGGRIVVLDLDEACPVDLRGGQGCPQCEVGGEGTFAFQPFVAGPDPEPPPPVDTGPPEGIFGSVDTGEGSLASPPQPVPGLPRGTGFSCGPGVPVGGAWLLAVGLALGGWRRR